MPYDVCGWIEGRWSSKNDDGSDNWYALLNLSPFFLFGDAISSEMFGLAKSPSNQPHFADRGIPQNASSIVMEDFERNKSFVEKNGDGDFGHTYALYSELKPLLLNMKKVPSRLLGETIYRKRGRPSGEEQSNWAPVLAILELLTHRGFESDSLRVIVWANW